MNAIVDTSVWSLALRRGAPRQTPHERELAELIREGRVLMMGPIRQEILSGVRAPEQFKALRDRLRAFPDIELQATDYEEAGLRRPLQPRTPRRHSVTPSALRRIQRLIRRLEQRFPRLTRSRERRDPD